MSARSLLILAWCASAVFTIAPALAQEAPRKAVDLSLTVADSSDPVDVGAEVTYTVTIDNLSTVVDLPEAFVELEVHNGLRIVSIDCGGQVLAKDLPPGQTSFPFRTPKAVVSRGRLITTVRTVVVRETAGTVFLEVNAGLGSTGYRDTDWGNNRTVHSTRVRGPAAPPEPGSGAAGDPPPDKTLVDLSLSITDERDPVATGEEYTYRLTVTNPGLEPVKQFTVQIANAGCELTDSAWRLGSRSGGPLGPGQSTTMEVPVRATAPAGELARLQGLVTASRLLHIERNRLDNSANESTRIRAGAAEPSEGTFLAAPGDVDMAITVRDSRDPVDDGESFEFDVEVINNRPSVPEGAMLRITPPPGIEIVGIGQAGAWPAGCTREGPVVCPLQIVRGTPSRIRVFARANLPAGGTAVTKFAIETSSHEVDPTDDSRDEPTTIRPKGLPGGGSGLEIPDGPRMQPRGAGPATAPSGAPGGAPPASTGPPAQGPPAGTPAPPRDGESEPQKQFDLRKDVENVRVELTDSKDPVEDGEHFYYVVTLSNDRKVESGYIGLVTLSAAPGIVFEKVLSSERVAVTGEGTATITVQLRPAPSRPFNSAEEAEAFGPIHRNLRPGEKLDISFRARADLPGGGTVPVNLTVGALTLAAYSPVHGGRSVLATQTTTILPAGTKPGGTGLQAPPNTLPLAPSTPPAGNPQNGAIPPAAPGPAFDFGRDPKNIAVELTDSKDPVADGEIFWYTITLVNSGGDPAGGISSVRISAGPGIKFEDAYSADRLSLNGVGTSTLDIFPYRPPGIIPVDATNGTASMGDLVWTPLENRKKFDISVRAVGDLVEGGTVPVEVKVGATTISGGLVARSPGKSVLARETTTVVPRTKPPGTALHVQPAPPSTVPSTPSTPGGRLRGATPLNREGDLFSPPAIDRVFDRSDDPQAPARPDLKVGMSFSPPQLAGGATGTILVNVDNTGAGNASGVFLRLNLPSQLEFQTATPSRGSCTRTGGGVDCTLGEIGSGANTSVPIVFRAQSGASGSVTASAALSLDQPDANPANNQATASLTITTAPTVGADCFVNGTASPATFVAGQTGSYRWQFRNSGPGDAANARATLTVPPNFTVQSTTSSAGSCAPSGNGILCNFGIFSNGGAIDVQMLGMVGSGASGSLTSTASITSDTSDPNPANNQSSVSAPVSQPAASADLQLATNAPAAIATSQVFRYSHNVINNGPSPATGVVVTNTIDANAIFFSCSPTCTPPAGGDRIVRCTVPTMAPGTTGAVFVDVRAPASPATLTNQATVNGAESDPKPSNNATTNVTTVNSASPASCALGISAGSYGGDGGCGATGTTVASCTSSSELRLQNAALNLLCNSSGNCGDNNVVFGQPNHRCTVQNPGANAILLSCEQLTSTNSCSQQFTKN